MLTLDIFHDHTQVASRLEGAEHGDDKGVLCEREDVPLHEGLLDLVPQDQVLLVDFLHGKALPRLSVAHQVDGTGQRERQEGQNASAESCRRDTLRRDRASC